LSRLFEALSNLEPERRSPRADRLVLLTPHGRPADATATEVAPPDKAEDHPLAAALPSVVSPDVRTSDATTARVVAAEIAEQGNESNETAPGGAEEARSVAAEVSPESHLVALTDPHSLGAEKFRALVTRLDDLRKQRELKSFQVTSSVINEGKTLVAANVAVTLAKYSGSRTLLIEGDLHRPTLAALLGLGELRGLSHWWSGRDPELNQFIYKLDDMPLWLLSAGKIWNSPSDVLRSTRFAKAFAQLASQFEWVVVDSTPMLPIVDANLWSRLVDGTLLVVREGLTPVKVLKSGLKALDGPKLIGVVINEASESDHRDYDGQYYGSTGPRRLDETSLE
jgi:protein-tyrosine kinase